MRVLGLDIAVVDYAKAVPAVQELARSGRTAAVSAANTQIAAAAYWNTTFRGRMARFDLVLPDGMPLVWCMNAQGAGLTDRVYGPIFMEQMLASTPKLWKHFLFGGSPECLATLQETIGKRFPDVAIAGTLSPPFRKWEESDLALFAATIESTAPDFIWVALGGIKQETWIADNLHRFNKGVFLAVGDAFELLAGRRRMAPMWMQRSGLGWVFRLCQEPRRLWKRYLVYNTLFVLALLCWSVGLRRRNRNPSQPKTNK
jgi:N-acetylglucosaminyldiphosphoundecaprenol N-acetyl-beta-D-mannosaminyltransferase